MVRVTWDEVGKKFFETGVDRGVLYPKNSQGLDDPGVAWNGLTSVNERPSGGEIENHYRDGVKYLAHPSSTDFEATLSAITYPIEFEPCEGIYEMASGILVTHQKPRSFGLSYRTLLGNDLLGSELGYKLHLVYGARVSPPQKAYATVSQTTTPNQFAWDITATPVPTTGFKPMGHLVLDSTRMDPVILALIEDILYGGDGTGEEPRLPLPAEILSLTLGSRFVIVVASPDEGLVPPSAQPGDVVYSQSNDGVYSVDTAPSDDVRPVFVISENDPIPDNVIVGDLVYIQETGELFQVGA